MAYDDILNIMDEECSGSEFDSADIDNIPSEDTIKKSSKDEDTKTISGKTVEQVKPCFIKGSTYSKDCFVEIDLNCTIFVTF